MCKPEMEDEYHFCMPRLPEKKKMSYSIITRKMSPNEIFIFLINPPNQRPETHKLKATQVFECFRKRNEKEDKN